MNLLTSYNPTAYQFAKAIHGHIEKARAVMYRWNKVANGHHEVFSANHLRMVAYSAGDDWSGYWDEVPSASPDGDLMTYLAGKSW